MKRFLSGVAYLALVLAGGLDLPGSAPLGARTAEVQFASATQRRRFQQQNEARRQREAAYRRQLEQQNQARREEAARNRDERMRERCARQREQFGRNAVDCQRMGY